ncbi:hypothetical protein HMPREF0380_01192 [Eubacterium infirmum F0142]|nr:hypothetical protein HMPREF0380_01192 [Eubacterium infirmum F0142]
MQLRSITKKEVEIAELRKCLKKNNVKVIYV